MAEPTHKPYEVTSITHGTSFKDDRQVGEYTVHIKHASGVKSSFTVPEGPNAAADAHAAAMQQVQQAQQIQALPVNAVQ